MSQALDIAIVGLVDAITDLCQKCAEGNDSFGNPPDSLREAGEMEAAIRHLVHVAKEDRS